MLTIEEFCDRHGACREGREWALVNCGDMLEVWEKARPEWLIWVATRPGVLDDRSLRLFACWCVRQVWHLLADERSRQAVEVAERFANGLATDQELDAAEDAAEDAARAAARAAVSAAVSAAARAAARAAVSAAGAAWAAAWAAALDAAWAAAWDAAEGAVRAAQAQYLRETGKAAFSFE